MVVFICIVCYSPPALAGRRRDTFDGLPCSFNIFVNSSIHRSFMVQPSCAARTFKARTSSSGSSTVVFIEAKLAVNMGIWLPY